MTNTKFADLHMHSNRSDGADSPTELVAEAARLGFSSIAITDHDTVSGYDEAVRAGEIHGIEVISGIEVSTNFRDASVHILGYFIDPTTESIQRLVNGNYTERVNRLEAMVKKIIKLGYPINLEEVNEFIGSRIPGRALLARYLVQAGHFSHMEAVFQKILGDGKPAYEPLRNLTPEDAISIIASSGGVSSLAHPGCTKVDKSIPSFAEAGLDAIEAISSQHSESEVMNYLGMARGLGLAITGGSDCHSIKYSSRKLGAMKLPYHRVEKLKSLATERAAA